MKTNFKLGGVEISIPEANMQITINEVEVTTELNVDELREIHNHSRGLLSILIDFAGKVIGKFMPISKDVEKHLAQTNNFREKAS